MRSPSVCTSCFSRCCSSQRRSPFESRHNNQRPVPAMKLTYFRPLKAPAPRGGGSNRTALPAKQGSPPPTANRTFIPPTSSPNPQLALPITIAFDIPTVDTGADIGDPLSKLPNGGLGMNGRDGIGDHGCCQGIGESRSGKPGMSARREQRRHHTTSTGTKSGTGVLGGGTQGKIPRRCGVEHRGGRERSGSQGARAAKTRPGPRRKGHRGGIALAFSAGAVRWQTDSHGGHRTSEFSAVIAASLHAGPC